MKPGTCLCLFLCILCSGISAQKIDSLKIETWENNAWKKMARQTYTYDDKNNVTQVVGETWSSTAGIWEKGTNTVYSYKNSLTDVVTIQMWRNGKWENSERLAYSYDITNNIETTVIQVLMGTTWQDWSRIVKTYNSSGQLTKSEDEAFDFTYMKFKLANQTINSFNADGTNKQTLILKRNFSSWKNAARYSFEYNGTQITTTMLTELFISNTWMPDSRSVVSYNKSLNISNFNPTYTIKETLYQNWDASGMKWLDDYRETYSYNSAGANTEILTQTWSSNAWKNETKITIYPAGSTTSTKSEPTEQKSVIIYPNPFTDRVTICQKLPGESIISVYNLSGTLLKSHHAQGSISTFNLSELPGGQYLIRIVSPGANFTEKVIRR